MPYTDMFEIVDSEGTIYSGAECEIQNIWDEIVWEGNPEGVDWTGDLRLIKVVDIHN